MASSWMDNKIVTMMSTNTQPHEMGSVLRRKKDGTRHQIPCHQSIINYNMFMGGVDQGDQLRGYYKYRIKTRKFYKYVFFFLFEVAVTNGYILYKHYTDNSRCKKLKEFHLMLAEQLIGDYCTRHRLGRSGLPINSLPLRHFPVKLTNESSKHRRGRCNYCSQFRRHRCDSSWYCNECKVWLCHSGDPQSDCFLLWHKKIQ